MKNHFLKLLSLTAVISIFFWADAYTDSQPAVGEIAPTFKLQDQNGDWHTLEDYKGQLFPITYLSHFAYLGYLISLDLFKKWKNSHEL